MMVIDCKKYFSSDDLAESIQFSFDIADTETGGKKLFPRPVRIQADVKSFSGSALVDLEIDAAMAVRCDRCGEAFLMDVSMDISHVIVPELSGEEDDDRYIVLDNEQVDLDELAKEDIYLNLPSKILCREDCKGLCPVCGMNLNEGTCDCRKNPVDPRLQGLEQLLDKEDRI